MSVGERKREAGGWGDVDKAGYMNSKEHLSLFLKDELGMSACEGSAVQAGVVL